MRYLNLVILQIYISHHRSLVISGPLEVPLHPPISGDDIAQSATTTLEYFRTENPIKIQSIGTSETHTLKRSEGLAGSKSQYLIQILPMDQQKD